MYALNFIERTYHLKISTKWTQGWGDGSGGKELAVKNEEPSLPLQPCKRTGREAHVCYPSSDEAGTGGVPESIGWPASVATRVNLGYNEKPCFNFKEED